MADVLKAMTNKPVPGQSLTRPPESRAPYEQPPVTTRLEEATQNIFRIITQEQFMDGMAKAANQGTGVFLDRLAGVVLHEAFSTGKITPDLAILAIEPTIEALMFVCSLLDIPVKFSTDNRETDWTGTMKVASRQAKQLGASSPASLQEWLAQNEQPEEVEVTTEKVKAARSLLSPRESREEATPQTAPTVGQGSLLGGANG